MEQKNSALGLTSFFISLITGILMFGLIVIAGVIENLSPGALDEETSTAFLVGLLAIFFLFLEIVALGLGIAGLVQKNCKKVFAILGVVFSSGTILITLFVIFLGLLIGE